MDLSKLSEFQKDAFSEFSSIGAGHAATALSQLIDEKVLISSPELDILPIEELANLMGGPETLVATIYIKMLGDIKGKILFMLPRDSAFKLIKFLENKPANGKKLFTQLDQELFRQTGVIIAGSYLNALTRFLELAVLPSSGDFAYDMAGAIFEEIIVELGLTAELALVVKTNFIESEDNISAHLFFLPEPESLELIFNKLEEKSTWVPKK